MRDDLSTRTAIVEALQSMARLGINKGTAGNISVRGAAGFHISPTGLPYAGMTPEQIVFMDWEGRYEGDILVERPELNAVVHTHSAHATAVSILGHDIPAIHYMVAAAGGNNIRCASYQTFGSAELGQAVLVALKDRRACLMAHHGVIAAHANLAQAMTLAVTVEEMAQLYLQVLAFGAPKLLSDEEMARVLEKFRTYGQQPRAAQETRRQAT